MKENIFTLPVYRHLPGQNARPGDGLLESIVSQVSTQSLNGEASNNRPWCYAIRLINEGYNWEAHEVLEALWNCALPNSRERWLIQCLIQLSNARLKMELSQPKAAKRLKQLTLDCYGRAYALHTKPLMGIQPTALLAAIEVCDSVVEAPPKLLVERTDD